MIHIQKKLFDKYHSVEICTWFVGIEMDRYLGGESLGAISACICVMDACPVRTYVEKVKMRLGSKGIFRYKMVRLKKEIFNYMGRELSGHTHIRVVLCTRQNVQRYKDHLLKNT